MNNSKVLKKVNYKGEELYLHLAYYTDGKLALILHPEEEFFQSPDSYVLTSNIDSGFKYALAINNHDYHQGNLQFLVDEGIVNHYGFVDSGWVRYPLCYLTQEYDLID